MADNDTLSASIRMPMRFSAVMMIGFGLCQAQSTVPRLFLGPPVAYSRGDLPFGTPTVGAFTAIADLNGDGTPDVIVAGANKVNVFLGRSDGTLGPKTDVASGVLFSGIAIADVNSDGRPDVLVADQTANRSTSNIVILLGDGRGGFSSGGSLAVDCPLSMAVADFNRDGRPDIAVSQGCGVRVFSVFLGSGGGKFGPPAQFQNNGYSGAELARTARSIDVGDVNHDGNPDLVIANTENGNISIFHGDGRGGFQLSSFTRVSDLRPLTVALADLNGDRNLDLIVSFVQGRSIAVFFADSSGYLFAQPAVQLPLLGFYSPSTVAADFNGDGKVDIAVTNHSGAAGDLGASLFINNGNNGFLKRLDIAGLPTSPSSIAAADFNRDGRTDAVVGSDDAALVLLNTSQSHRAWIDVAVNGASFQEGPVSPGEIVTIFGQGIGPDVLVGPQLDDSGRLSTARSQVRVLFDGVPAPIIYVLATQMSVMVPYAPRSRPSSAAGTVIEVEYRGEKSNPIWLDTADSAPGIFALDSTGIGQGAILNQDQTINGRANPADRGSIVSLFITGEGQTNPSGVDGKLATQPLPTPILPVAVSIGGISSEVVYSGGAPGAVAGLMQINARIPQAVTPGASVPTLVTVGTARSQSGVTIAVR
ncbi:MAG: FG-GAP-like repeat-containing protein [Acidobacteria bacterium]|nr:FG-GAP-like repeat-containing protein [Acidobacteriota bacterium]